jgi:hypothetical protein
MKTCGTCGITVNPEETPRCLACRSAWLVPGRVTGEGLKEQFGKRIAPDKLPWAAKIRADAFCRATELNPDDEGEIVSCVQDTVKAEAKFAIEIWMPSLKRRHIFNSLIFIAGLGFFLLGGFFFIVWLAVSTYWIIRVARTFSISTANLEASRFAAIEFIGAFHERVNKTAKLNLYLENPPR